MVKELQGLWALVTGGAKGIGRAISLELAKNGASLFVHYNNSHKEALELKELIEKEFKSICVLVRGDLSSFQDVKNIIEEIKKNREGVEIFVANAGYSSHFRLEELSWEEWEKSLRVNLSHAFFFSQAFSNYMKNINFGRIIFISSLRYRTGSPKGFHYAASKTGLIGLAKSLALYLGPFGITVNTIVPGYVFTDMTQKTILEKGDEIIKSIPVRKIGSPWEIARVVNFLASPKSGYINGAVIDINGGIYFP